MVVLIDVEGWRQELLLLLLLHYFNLSAVPDLRLICRREGLNNLHVVAVWRAFFSPLVCSVVGGGRGDRRVTLVALLPVRVGRLLLDPDGRPGVLVPRLRVIIGDSRDRVRRLLMLIGALLHVEIGDLGWSPFHRVKAQLELTAARLPMNVRLQQHLPRLLRVLLLLLRPALLLVRGSREHGLHCIARVFDRGRLLADMADILVHIGRVWAL